ncbi:hypothetical protein FKZ61_011635 [Litorilinea aerophila]|uniref:WW domain-containing protein n=1 Tax=Litorilinea aerophila TaxID=1204385 RepID=A0A540VFD2_9CHLR|nr:sialidase family protein [Litorilinea aerophila]MCC9076759.1 hypothetical protein [Litorilinea aerophila]
MRDLPEQPDLPGGGLCRRPGWLLAVAIALALGMGLWGSAPVLAAPGDIVDCRPPFNLSNSPGYVSVDPFLLSDPTGVVHLFWAERTIGEPGDIPNVPDALMYSRWDGERWSKPVDIFISPRQYFNRRIAGIRGVMDQQGFIHLVWMGPDNTFFYSAARADRAGSAQGWLPPLLLGDDQSGTQFSVDIAYEPPRALHILYGRSQPQVNRTVTYIRSVDGGATWSEPVDVYTFLDFERGASNVRLLTEPPGKVYATWTEWDSSGNGQAVYFARSLDSGSTWEEPVRLAERVGDEYERDWTTLAVLEPGRLVALWEGGFRAYPQTQYSDDGGATWSAPIDTFFWLIADNGFGEFVRDSTGRLHVFLVRRIREGYSHLCGRFVGCRGDGNTIWHSVWEAGVNWRDPRPVGGFHDSNFISVAMNLGNQLFLSWFNYDNPETSLDIFTMQCTVEGAPALAPQPWPAVDMPTPTPVATAWPTPTPLPEVTATPAPVVSVQATPVGRSNPATPLLVGALPSLALLVLAVMVERIRRRGR